MSEPSVRVERAGPVTTVILSRPQVHNAVDRATARALADAFRAFQADDAGAPNSSWSWVGTFLNARAGTIYAGSSQIQRNIIGEMILGLPKEPRPA